LGFLKIKGVIIEVELEYQMKLDRVLLLVEVNKISTNTCSILFLK